MTDRRLKSGISEPLIPPVRSLKFKMMKVDGLQVAELKMNGLNLRVPILIALLSDPECSHSTVIVINLVFLNRSCGHLWPRGRKSFSNGPKRPHSGRKWSNEYMFKNRSGNGIRQR